MKFSVALEEAWKDVEEAYNSGYLVNESMMAFTLWRAINDRRPDLSITFDARIDSRRKRRPDFVVWEDGANPSVLFVCELKFKPYHYSKYRGDIAKLQKINKKRVLDVLKRNPLTGEIETIAVKKSEDFGIGFFAIANHDAAADTRMEVTEPLSAIEKAIFHFAFGSIPCKSGELVEFNYSPPEC